MNVSTNLDLIRGYQTYLRVEKGLRPLTCDAYERDLLQLAEYLETTDGGLLEQAQRENLSGFLEHLQAHHVEMRSRARKLSCLRGFYRWLLLDKSIAYDPTVNLESPSGWKVLPKSLAESEMTEMLEQADTARLNVPTQKAQRCATTRFWSCCTAAAFAFRNWWICAWKTSPRSKGRFWCAARATRSALCRWDAPHWRRCEFIWSADGPTYSEAQGCAKLQHAATLRRSRNVSLCAWACADATIHLDAGEEEQSPRQPAHAAP